jgi:mRNA interferase MazF
LAGSLKVPRPYSVVVVPFPFIDRTVVRRRPALVVSEESFNSAHDALVLAMITVARASDWPSDVVLRDWQAAGLRIACLVRMKLFTLDNGLILDQLGTLTSTDRDRVAATLRPMLFPH